MRSSCILLASALFHSLKLNMTAAGTDHFGCWNPGNPFEASMARFYQVLTTLLSSSKDNPISFNLGVFLRFGHWYLHFSLWHSFGHSVKYIEDGCEDLIKVILLATIDAAEACCWLFLGSFYNQQQHFLQLIMNSILSSHIKWRI